MGETFSQLQSQQDESSPILPSNPAIADKATGYFSTSNKSFGSCVPFEGTSGVSSVTCPTCQGNGEIPRELEKQLVALIPYGDQRLKPRHTKLSVFLAVLIYLVAFSFIVFFLFPRSVIVQPAGLTSNVTFGKADIHLNLTHVLTISNNNYCPITVTQIIIKVLHLTLEVGKVSVSPFLHIGPLSSKQIFYEVPSRIVDENTYKICTLMKIKVHHVLLHIQGTLTYSYLSRSEQKLLDSYEYVDCRENTSVPHTASLHPS